MNENQRLLVEWMASHGLPKTSAEIKAAGFSIQIAPSISDNYKYSRNPALHKDQDAKPATWQITKYGKDYIEDYAKNALRFNRPRSESAQQRLVDALARIEELEAEVADLRDQLSEHETPRIPTLEEIEKREAARKEKEARDFRLWQRIENGQQ